MNAEVPEEVLRSPAMGRMLDAARERRRRLILLMLKRGEGGTETDFLPRGGDDVEDIELELLDTHLPKLEEAGYIEWDRETGEISRGPRFAEIEPLLELMEEHSDELPPGWP